MSRLEDLLPRYTEAEAETRALGRALAARLQPGDVVALYGDLGAGKTALAKGICEGLGIEPENVSSPTFTILHEHTDGRLHVYHFDAYRIESVEEFFDLGYEEYFYDEGVAVIEWADKIESILPSGSFRVRLTHETGDRRRVVLLDS